MKGYKKYIWMGGFVCFMAYALITPNTTEAFWPFSKAKKENNANYSGAVVNTSNKKVMRTITIISPKGGEVLQGGKNYAIKWKTTGLNKNEKVTITLFNKTGPGAYIATSTPNKGIYNWKVPKDISGINLFKVLVDIGILEAESDGFFSIGQKAQKLGITVLSPNGGEECVVGDVCRISWTYNAPDPIVPINLPNTYLSILLQEEDMDLYTIYNQPILNFKDVIHGIFGWQIPDNITAGRNYYKIKVSIYDRITGQIYAVDTSDAPFIILKK